MELIFVIVIIGILATVAIPRLFSGISDAEIAKVKTDVATIRSAISSKYGNNVIEGNNSCPDLEGSNNDVLFEGVLNYPIKKASGTVKWDGNGSEYNVTAESKTIYFDYIKDPDGKGCLFECNATLSTSPDFNCSTIGE